MKNKKILATALATTLVMPNAAALPIKVTAEAVQNKNVIFILGDDMGWMDTAVNGSTYYETPNLQRLARDGMVFTNAYAHPLCSPTRSALMCGQYAQRTPMYHAAGATANNTANFELEQKNTPAWQKYNLKSTASALPIDLKTVGDIFKEAGYKTGMIGKVHLGVDEAFKMGNRGFDVDMGLAVGGPGSYYAPYFATSILNSEKWNNENGLPASPDEDVTDRFAREVDKFLTDRAQNNEKFLLEAWDLSVHGPWQAKKEYVEYFKNKNVPDSPQNGRYIMGAMLKTLDDAVGKILDSLEENGLYDNTMICFMGDNGGVSYEELEGLGITNNYPLRQGKATVYEGGIRVPCIIRVPGVTAPQTTCGENIHVVDMLPTLMDYAGITNPTLGKNMPQLGGGNQVLDGVSIMPLLADHTKKLDRVGVFTAFMNYAESLGTIQSLVVNSGDWKLIHNFDTLGGIKEEWELYNLKENISETINLAADPNNAAILLKLKNALDEHLNDIPTMKLTANPNYSATEQIPSGYRAWAAWFDKFKLEVANDTTIGDGINTVFNDATTAYYNKIKNATIFKIGKFATIKNTYDDKITNKALLPYISEGQIFLPREYLGLDGSGDFVNSNSMLKTVTQYGDIIIVADATVELTPDEVEKTNALIDSYNVYSTVKNTARQTPTMAERFDAVEKAAASHTAPENMGALVKSWNFNSGVEGFYAGKTTVAVSQNNGSLVVDATDLDGFIYSPTGLNINASTARVLKVRYKNLSFATNMEFFWTTTASPGFDGNKKSNEIPIYSNMDDYATVYIDLSKYASWNGTISAVRFDPINNGWGEVLYDSIELLELDIPVEKKWTFDTNGSVEGWASSPNPIKQMEVCVADGILSTKILGGDAYLTKTGLTLPLDTYKRIKVRYKNATPYTLIEVYFQSTTSGSFGPATNKKFIANTNMTEFGEIILDMSDMATWSGVLQSLRLDIGNPYQPGQTFDANNPNNMFYIDEIELIGENPKVLYKNSFNSAIGMTEFRGQGSTTAQMQASIESGRLKVVRTSDLTQCGNLQYDASMAILGKDTIVECDVQSNGYNIFSLALFGARNDELLSFRSATQVAVLGNPIDTATTFYELNKNSKVRVFLKMYTGKKPVVTRVELITDGTTKVLPLPSGGINALPAFGNSEVYTNVRLRFLVGNPTSILATDIGKTTYVDNFTVLHNKNISTYYYNGKVTQSPSQADEVTVELAEYGDVIPVLAAYKGAKLVGIAVGVNGTKSITLKNIPLGTNIKLLMLNNLTDLKPLASAQVFI